MIMDQENLFSEDQEITAGSDSGILSTNTIDLGMEGRRIGVGKNLYLVVICTTSMTDSGSNSALSVDLQSDSAEAQNVAPVVHQRIGTFAAGAVAGSRLVARLQPSDDMKRYLRLKYTSTNGALSTGKFTAFLAESIDAQKAYPGAFSIA